MKTSMKRLVSLAIVFTTLFVSCDESKGPKGNVYIDDRTNDEIFYEMAEAIENDDWFHEYDVDLFKKVDGEWINVGVHSVYRNFADKDDDCNLWVEFEGPMHRCPVENTTKNGYNYQVRWQGDYYYF